MVKIEQISLKGMTVEEAYLFGCRRTNKLAVEEIDNYEEWLIKKFNIPVSKEELHKLYLEENR